MEAKFIDAIDLDRICSQKLFEVRSRQVLLTIAFLIFSRAITHKIIDRPIFKLLALGKAIVAMNRFCTIFCLTGISVIFFSHSAIALQTSSNTENTCSQTDGSISSDRPQSSAKSQLNTAQSSFWWATEQFDPFDGKLVQNWLTHPQLQQVNIVVNWQLWSFLDYFGRYRFVHQFGTVARKYGYSLNISDPEARCLATYQYNPSSNPPKWELRLEELGKDSLPIESSP